ncbi:MAG: DNA topoisomerase VI subunit B [Candidatus Korarchaeota archaeon NZ13-K]|nr:MAG: DNA topoisomerase VI subunit B [Candidatus Korarchaeota archaeon NZ13-K]
MTEGLRLEEISAADFFYRNRSLAGFDNPVRATYTIVRELVENSLDAVELSGRSPKVLVIMREEREADGERLPWYRIKVADNGIGLSPEEIPLAFGRVFVSSKYRLIQSRGTFGLGGTMALLYGQITTNMPFKVTSAREGEPAYEFTMMIDIRRNEPLVLERRVVKRVSRRSYTIVESVFEGSYQRARRKIVDYLQQTAIAVPYITIAFLDPDGRLYIFPRSTDRMPPRPKEALFHPKGVDLELLQRMLSTTRTRTLESFLVTHFQRVGKKTAGEVLRIAGLDPDKRPSELTNDEVRALYEALRSYKGFLPPDPSVLSPLGEELLESGIRKELHPEFVKAVQRPPSVYEAHPFIVETAIAYGGLIKPTGDIQLYRYANKIPLLYDVSSDVSYQVIRRIDWSVYGIKNPEDEPIAFFVHIVSTKVPFKTVGKEFIANVPEVAREIELGLRECARELRIFLGRKRRKEMLLKRYELFKMYYELISWTLEEILGERPPVERLIERIRSMGEEDER